MYKTFLLLFALLSFTSFKNPTSTGALKLALMKYNGGDWYANPTALPNLARFCNTELGTNFDSDYATVEIGSAELFNYPFVHMTGHGNVILSNAEAENLRNYLIGGGFLHIDDNYGMDPFIRVALKQVFPEQALIELPWEHEIYNQKFQFKSGVPKIHKHDDKGSQGLGILWEDRLVVFYSYESDLGDGWEDRTVHKDPEELRQQALRMGANIVQYAFEQ